MRDDIIIVLRAVKFRQILLSKLNIQQGQLSYQFIS